jgi:hypothetical protein
MVTRLCVLVWLCLCWYAGRDPRPDMVRTRV